MNPEARLHLESCLGWVLTGPCKKNESTCTSNFSVAHALLTTGESRLEDTVKKFWEIEAVGEPGENTVFDKFVDEIEFDGARYVTKLPFKPDYEFVPDNYRLSRKRLISLRSRLNKDPKLLKNYHW